MHFKHLQGQHDQRTHGRPGTGIGSGGYSSQLGQSSSDSSPQPRTDFLTDGEIPTELGQIGIDGLPSMKRVERGSNDIRDLDDAVDFLHNDGPLRDVPDDFLLAAMNLTSKGNNSRFLKGTVQGEGINGKPVLFTDRTNGQRYFAKYIKASFRPNEDVAEMLGNNIAGRLGFPIGATRIAGPYIGLEYSASYSQDSFFRRPLILEHVSNVVSGTIEEPTKSLAEKLPYDDLVSASILDYILLNPDRHEGNYFIAEQSGQPRFVPIDPSLGFNVDSRYRQRGKWSMRQLPRKDLPIDFAAETSREDIQNFFRFEQGLHSDLQDQLSKNNFDMDEERENIVFAIDRAKMRLLKSEQQLPFATAAMDALITAGNPIRKGKFDVPRNIRKSYWGDRTDSFIAWPSRRIETILGMDSYDIASFMLD